MATVEPQPFLPSLHTTLPPEFIRTDIDRPNIPHNHFCNDIPIISLAELFPSPGGPPETSTLARLADACADWGVFILVDHGVDPKLISSISDLSARFFSLPPEKKLEYVTGEGKQGGFNVSSHLKGEPVQDWREFFTFFSYPEEVRDYSRWPEEPEGWKDTVHKYCEASMRVASDVLEGLSLSLGAEKDAMKKACVRLEQKLLVNFYPKCSQPNLTLGLRRHTDPGTITLLLQDKVGGLQVTRDDGENWVTVPPVEGSFVVNLGDHGHYLSNGRFKSVEHRAVVNSNHSRLSIATFQYPAQDAVIIPLKKEEQEKSILEPMTFTEMYKRKMTYDIQVAKHREEEARNHQAIAIAKTKLNGNHI